MVDTVADFMNNDVTTLFVTDRHGNILLANEFTAMTLGIPLGELLNSNVYDLVNEKLYDGSATIKTLKTQEPSSVDLKTRVGYQIKSKSSPIFFPDGTLHLVVTKSDPIDEAEVKRWLRDVEKIPRDHVEKSDQNQNIDDCGGIVAESFELKKILRVCKQVSQYNSRILILGESGVGKEVIANYIHRHSTVADKPFIAINCAAIPENLFESEFFGHEKGTFTGAEENKMGLIEAASGGTLFLDEISEMPLNLQTKLLRVLETSTIRRVGSLKEIPVSFRLISACNQNLFEQVEEKRFRRDLYYRINAIPITIPPLRERRQDILALANHFLDKYNNLYQKNIILTPKNLNYLITNEWLGNVRELKNYIEYTVVTSDIEIDDEQNDKKLDNKLNLESSLQELAKNCDYKTFLQFVEKVYFKQKLTDVEWNISQAASNCHVSRPLIYKKIEELKL
ncbi:sigma-54 interaction domain-containing protein [Vagococcus vulneris]|uniref:Transcriptional regulator, RocR-like protein n=1 Tax=Vagococcus vulneris TaxID=1977869 RepID=A0A429ZX31_9ENTE|nr:sigma 54-interacting transcriptional regulator [Vagococcus vulneris]RST98406.1 transcriptional regulator, RocR-like protein [Vagococcus vulneris]